VTTEQTGSVELDRQVIDAARILRDTIVGGPAQGPTPAEVRERQVRAGYDACPFVGHHFLTWEEVIDGGLLREGDSTNPAVVRDRFAANKITVVRGALPADAVLHYLAHSRGRGRRRTE